MSHLNNSTIADLNSNPFNYPNPIPPPSTDTTYPNLESIETYIFTHAAQNGFEISIGDTRKNRMKYKCSLGPHGHKTKASTNPSTASLPSIAKTCPYKVNARRSPTTHEWRVEIDHGTHDHPPHSKPPVVRQPPKSRQRPVEVEDEVSESDKPQHQPPHPSPPSLQPQVTRPSSQYDALLSRMDRLPSDTRARLLKRFLRDCEVVQDALGDSSTSVEHKHSTTHSKPKRSKPSNNSQGTNPEQSSQPLNPDSNPESNLDTNTQSNTDSNPYTNPQGQPFPITKSNNINPIVTRFLKTNPEHHTPRLTEEQTVFTTTSHSPYTAHQDLRNQMQTETKSSQLSLHEMSSFPGGIEN